MLQRTVPRSLDQVTKRGFAHGSPPKAGGSRWDLEMQARKASQGDWLVLTHRETGQEKERRGHTDRHREQTTKAGPGCANKVNSQAEEDEKGICIQ